MAGEQVDVRIVPGRTLMRRLYWRIYAGIVLVILIFALMVGALRLLDIGGDRRNALVAPIAATVADLLPGADAEPARLQAILARLSQRFGADASVFGANGERLAAHGDPVPAPPLSGASGWVRDRFGHGFALALPDGRWLVARERGHVGRGGMWLVVLVLLALAIAVGAYPLARRISRRLERLQAGVEGLGAGDLSARVSVEGRDEVAELARAFNRSAGRIEQLVQAQRSTLFGASHELRSPLARIRVALELAGDGLRPDLRAGMERDVCELDDLIDELLLASRLQAGMAGPGVEDVELLGLLREEAARVGAMVEGESVTLRGEARLLRRLLRNLLENAARHGCGAPVAALLRLDRRGDVEILVEDAGPGVAPEHRERVFEPFFRTPGTAEYAGGGVGLGLSLVREIARHHGGDVTCEAREGGGTRMRARLPSCVRS